MFKKLLELGAALIVVGFLWQTFGPFHAPPEMPPVSSPPSRMPAPLETPFAEERDARAGRDELQEIPAAKEQPPEKKHLWGRTPKPEPVDDGLSDGAAPKDIRRPMSACPDRGERMSEGRELELPDAHFSGVKFYLWSRGPRGEWTCRGGEEFLQRLTRYAHEQLHDQYTVGDGPQFDVWVIRVPPNSERCPLLKFFYDGKEIPPQMCGGLRPEHLPFIFARIPHTSPDVDHWFSHSRRAPGPVAGGASLWPGLGIRYRSTTDVGVGLGGFNAGGSPFGGS